MPDLQQQADGSAPDRNVDSASALDLQSQADVECKNTKTSTERCAVKLMLKDGAIEDMGAGHSKPEEHKLADPVDKHLSRILCHLRTTVTTLEEGLVKCRAECSAINHPFAANGA